MSKLERLRNSKDLKSFARLVGFRPAAISYLLYIVPKEERYTTFEIPKKGGGVREINAPNDQLKLLQSRLARVLQDCFEEIQSEKGYKRSLSHGFRRSHSIVTNAATHRNRRYVFNLDLEDFFPSVNFGRVRGYFLKNNQYLLDESIATVIAQIACHENALPQGSPLSPIVSNLIAQIMDARLLRLSCRFRCTYSRYADDLTFSTNMKQFPRQIAAPSNEHDWKPGDQLERLIHNCGFTINYGKVSMQYKSNRQSVTGLTVNKKVNVRAPYYRQARAMCDSLFKSGSFYWGNEFPREEGSSIVKAESSSMRQLRGVLSHIYHVKTHNWKSQARQGVDSKTNERNSIFSQFVWFDKFYHLDRPLLFCEGKTDNVYLKCAIESLVDRFPTLATKNGSIVDKKIDFFNHSKSNLKLLDISSGSGGMATLIQRYQTEMKRFRVRGMQAPVVLLVDDDEGAKKVYNAAKQLTKSTEDIDGSKRFYHLALNLYIVALTDGTDNPKTEKLSIEDLFDADVLSTQFQGKTFEPNKGKFDDRIHFNKQIFAERIIKPKKKTIDFQRFIPTLQRIEAAIEHYSKNTH